MSYQRIPVEPPGEDAFRNEIKYSKPFTESSFAEAENLKLRGIAMTDRLSVSNQIRRRAHRDLVFWYTALGKTDKAEKQKQILFELVGIHDDRILNPTGGTCGQIIWWTLPTAGREMRFCGLG